MGPPVGGNQRARRRRLFIFTARVKTARFQRPHQRLHGIPVPQHLTRGQHRDVPDGIVLGAGDWFRRRRTVLPGRFDGTRRCAAPAVHVRASVATIGVSVAGGDFVRSWSAVWRSVAGVVGAVCAHPTPFRVYPGAPWLLGRCAPEKKSPGLVLREKKRVFVPESTRCHRVGAYVCGTQSGILYRRIEGASRVVLGARRSATPDKGISASGPPRSRATMGGCLPRPWPRLWALGVRSW